MDRSLVVLLFSKSLRESGKSHGVMGIGDWKSLRLPEQSPGRREEGLAKNDRSNGQRSQERLFVIQRLGFLPYWTRVEGLKVAGDLSIPIKPPNKPGNCPLKL